MHAEYVICIPRTLKLPLFLRETLEMANIWRIHADLRILPSNRKIHPAYNNTFMWLPYEKCRQGSPMAASIKNTSSFFD
jgi:hypothetical protein